MLLLKSFSLYIHFPINSHSVFQFSIIPQNTAVNIFVHVLLSGSFHGGTTPKFQRPQKTHLRKFYTVQFSASTFSVSYQTDDVPACGGRIPGKLDCAFVRNWELKKQITCFYSFEISFGLEGLLKGAPQCSKFTRQFENGYFRAYTPDYKCYIVGSAHL